MQPWDRVRIAALKRPFATYGALSEKMMANHYFRVPSIKAAAETAAKAGGTIRHGPVEVPNGDHIVQGVDPQGAAFALVGGA